MVREHLKQSKCSQLGRGVDVFLGHTGTEVCPIVEVLNYISIRGPAPGAFFIFRNHAPLTKATFVARIREALGRDPQAYAGYSFQTGAATTAANASLEDSVIQSLGRWNSNAFLRYIHTPRDRLATYSRDLA